jgi:hypothetical protein
MMRGYPDDNWRDFKLPVYPDNRADFKPNEIIVTKPVFPIEAGQRLQAITSSGSLTLSVSDVKDYAEHIRVASRLVEALGWSNFYTPGKGHGEDTYIFVQNLSCIKLGKLE